jgi:hypothetical protein
MKHTKKPIVADSINSEAVNAIVCGFKRALLRYNGLVRLGNTVAISELPLHACVLVEALEEVVSQHPNLLIELAQHQVSWPIMAARHYPKESDFGKLADRIKLGSKAVVNLSPRARYKLATPINRFLLRLLEGSIATAKEFYFVQLPDNPPKLTSKTAPYYLDDFVMPMLDRIREKEGSWNGIPAVADIVKGIAYESEHRSAVRNRIKRALKAMSAPDR